MTVFVHRAQLRPAHDQVQRLCGPLQRAVRPGPRDVELLVHLDPLDSGAKDTNCHLFELIGRAKSGEPRNEPVAFCPTALEVHPRTDRAEPSYIPEQRGRGGVAVTEERHEVGGQLIERVPQTHARRLHSFAVTTGSWRARSRSRSRLPT